MQQKKRILLLCSASFSLSNFRGDLIEHLIENGFQVFCAAPDFTTYTLGLVEKLGGIPIAYKLQRTGLNPFNDLKTIKELRSIMRANKIDILFPYTIKPVIYGSFAARKSHIPIISLITGLGFTFSQVSLKAQMLQWVTEFLYRKALRGNMAVVFQNSDDLQLFIDRNIVSKKQSLHVVDGSGINLNKFSFKPRVRKGNSVIKFVLVGRLMKEKGVELFMNAAKILRHEYPNSQFHIIGEPPESGSSAVSGTLLNEFHEEGIIVYHGKSDNVAEAISKMDVFVLPTYYREGVPRSILEALSSGMPIITTNQPGCKETVMDRENGFLIATRNQDQLMEAIRYFLDHPEKIESMGKESRNLAESKFDVDKINANLLNIINNAI